jgi:hypothetical protein
LEWGVDLGNPGQPPSSGGCPFFYVSNKKHVVGEITMKSTIILSFAAGIFVATNVTAEAIEYSSGVSGCDSSPDYFVTGDVRNKIEVGVYVHIAQVNDLVDNSVLIQLLNESASKGFSTCAANYRPGAFSNPPPTIAAIFVDGKGERVLTAWTNKADGQWYFVENNISKIVAYEDSQKAQEDERKQAQRAQEQAQRADAEARQKRKQVAIADCGAATTISGGPWFSSTYKIAAQEAARTYYPNKFLCVKTVKYVSDAPNPFGGKAARAEFVGYDMENFNFLSQVLDFPY